MSKISLNSKIFIDRISNDCILSDNKFSILYNFLNINWYEITKNELLSDIVILDLCWVNKWFLKKTENKIDYYLSLNKKILLFWCISPYLKEKYKELTFIDSNNLKILEDVFQFNKALDSLNNIIWKKINVFDLDNSFKNYNKNYRNKSIIDFIHISDGCNWNCSYCNIKKIKWNTKSRNIELILSEILDKYINWKREFFLLSDDCGSYGIDIKENFWNLMNSILSLKKDIKIYITNIHPFYFIKYFDTIFKYSLTWQIKEIILPVQHTVDRILKIMRRPYFIDDLLPKLYKLRSIKWWVYLVNHIIFDYYDESLDEFKDTFRLLPYYDKTYYFKYSDFKWNYNSNKKKLFEKVFLLKKLQKKYNIDIVL